MQFKFFKKFLLISALAAVFIFFYYSCKTSQVVSESEPYGLIEVISNPTGASIYMDGLFTLHYTNHTLQYVPVGSHIITLKITCYKDFEITLNVQENQTTTVNAVMERLVPEGENTIYGSVYYSTTPLDGIKVELYTIMFGSLIQSTVSGNGSYKFSSVLPGRFSMKAYAPTDEYMEWRFSPIYIRCMNVEKDIYLRKKLIITWPRNDSTVNTKYPTISWEANSVAVKYSIHLFETLSSDTVVSESNNTSTSYSVESALIPGIHYTGEIKGWDSQENLVAEGEVKFTVSRNINDGL